MLNAPPTWSICGVIWHGNLDADEICKRLDGLIQRITLKAG
jgi:hypothetical protein